MTTTISPQAAARRARAEAVAQKARDFLELHGYTGPLDQGTFHTCRCCPHCGREHEHVSKSFPGGQGIWVFVDEEDRRWRVDIRRENSRHHRFYVNDGEHCPVLAFALADLAGAA